MTFNSAQSIALDARLPRKPIRLYREAIAIALLLIALLPISVPLAIGFDQVTLATLDHKMHEQFARHWVTTGELPTAHFLYQAFLIALYDLTGDNWELATALAMTLPHLIFALIVYALARWLIGGERWWHYALCALVAFTLTIAVPPVGLGWLLTGYEPMWYLLGYITLTVYHNPTYTLLRPLALLLFIAALQTLAAPERQPIRRALPVTGALAALTALNMLAKPSFVIVLLPALGLWTLWRLLRRQPVAWLPLSAGIGVPALLGLYWQYSFFYSEADGARADSGIIFAPLEAFYAVTGWDAPVFGVYLLVSALIPAAIYLLGGRAARADAAFNLGWLMFAIGAAYTYLFAETGPRFAALNFAWSGYSGALILYGMALFFGLRVAVGQIRITGRRRWLFLSAAGVGLVVTLVYGVLYLAKYLEILDRYRGM
ncbi:MAG: hypothetical protein ACUVS2_10760 [Candidatus Flexifilum sp.]|jgi:hypothetical protein